MKRSLREARAPPAGYSLRLFPHQTSGAKPKAVSRPSSNGWVYQVNFQENFLSRLSISFPFCLFFAVVHISGSFKWRKICPWCKNRLFLLNPVSYVSLSGLLLYISHLRMCLWISLLSFPGRVPSWQEQSIFRHFPGFLSFCLWRACKPCL